MKRGLSANAGHHSRADRSRTRWRNCRGNPPKNYACGSPVWSRTGDTRARARSTSRKGHNPCLFNLESQPAPHSGLDRLCYKNEPFVSSGQLLSMLKQLASGDTVMVTRIDRLRTQHL